MCRLLSTHYPIQSLYQLRGLGAVVILILEKKTFDVCIEAQGRWVTFLKLMQEKKRGPGI